MSGSPAAAPANRPEPHQDRPVAGADAPGRTGRLLGLVRKLIDYGKEFASSLQQRASAASLARATLYFGTIDIALIRSRVIRGLHRAAALAARLLGRVAREAARPAAASAPPHRQARAAQPAARRAHDADPHLARLPTPGDIVAEVRRRPVGAVIADICRDLGIVPSNPLWPEVSSAIVQNGGSIATLYKDITERMANAIFDPRAIARPAGPAPCLPSPAASGAGPPWTCISDNQGVMHGVGLRPVPVS